MIWRQVFSGGRGRAGAAGGPAWLVTRVVLVVALLAGCAPATIPTVLPGSSGPAATSDPVGTADPPATASRQCDDATASYQPPSPMPSPQQAAALDPTISAILARGYLIVGVSADTRQLGARNPLTNQIEGFDIDMAKAVAQALFGDPNRVRLLVISAGDRIPSLRSAEVDMVARAMTMTCERWQQVSFSSEYYAAGQKVLVGWNPAAGAPRPSTSLADLVGHRVCATAKTSSLERLHSYPGVKVVVGSSHTDCLVKFQQGEADAITGDDTVLAGLATQDPYAVITSAPAISSEPYGLAVAKERTYFAAYLNGVLEQVRADGRWQASYQTWLEPTLGPSVGPPTPVYGRG